MSTYKIIFIGKKKKYGSPVGTGVETSQIQAAILHSDMTVKGMLMNEDCLNKYSKKKKPLKILSYGKEQALFPQIISLISER